MNDEVIAPAGLDHWSGIRVIEDLRVSLQIAIWSDYGIGHLKPIFSCDSFRPYFLVVDGDIKLCEERLSCIRIAEPTITRVRPVT